MNLYRQNIQTNIETMYHKGSRRLSSGINPILEKENGRKMI